MRPGRRMACPLVSSSEDRVDGNLVLVQMVWMSTVLMRVPMRTVSKLYRREMSR